MSYLPYIKSKIHEQVACVFLGIFKSKHEFIYTYTNEWIST
jgi:hypothetical protein